MLRIRLEKMRENRLNLGAIFGIVPHRFNGINQLCIALLVNTSNV
jgi:hypothetical protein